jgi:hypothetical protein
MELTTDFLVTLYKRVEYIFYMKHKVNPDDIHLTSSGNFYCYYEYSVSYGGTETISELISIKDLTSDLDELIKNHEIEKEEKRIAQEKWLKERQLRKEKEDKEKRRKEFEKLKKEFE